MSMNAWHDAKAALLEARQYLGMVGKPQRTTIDAVGVWHSLSVRTQVYYQPTDGAKNYHESMTFDKALSVVMKNHIHALQAEAIQLLEDAYCTAVDYAAAVVAKTDPAFVVVDQIDGTTYAAA